MTLGVSIDRIMQAGIADGVFPGGVVLVRHRGDVVLHRAYGHAVLYADAHTRAADPIPTTLDTVYDLASLTKLFTATCVMTLVEAGLVRLDDPIAMHVPPFAANGKEEITVRHLLTHTAGLPYVRLWEVAASSDERIAHAMAVTPEAPPGTIYTYHDTNFIVLGRLIEEITHQHLDRALAERVLAPLGLAHTCYCPPEETRQTVAATEDAAAVGRGMVRDEVHDENAWSLGGVAGHAGLFGSATDIGVFGQVFLDVGLSSFVLSNAVGMLAAESVAEMTRDQIGALGNRGLGWQLDEPSHMGRLASPATFGHTGFTGTSLVIDPDRQIVMVLLTNRVHPTRTGPDVYAVRRAVADAIADSVDLDFEEKAC
ncbi:MAG: serine hydrolase domain-containing protein [Thermomicrobiales bacterium]